MLDFFKNMTKKKYSSADISFIVFFVILFLIFLLSWFDATIPILNWKINKQLISHWVPLFTLLAFGITLYKQLTLESRLNLQKKAVVSTNNKICYGLLDDINSIISVHSNKTAYHAINLLRERVEIHLEYCQSCCDGQDKEDYGSWALALNRYEHQLRAKIKSDSVNFNDDKFVDDMKEFKRFLIQKDNIVLN